MVEQRSGNDEASKRSNKLVEDEETTERTEITVNSTSSKDSRPTCLAETTIACSHGSDSTPSEITHVHEMDDQAQQLSSVASDDLTISNQSYIMDLTCQKQQRDRDRHEEAFEEAIERMKVTGIDADSDEYAIAFLQVLKQVKGEIKQKYEEHDRLQDERLASALKDSAPTSARSNDVLQNQSKSDLLGDVTPERPRRKQSDPTSKPLYEAHGSTVPQATSTGLYSTNDTPLVKPDRVESKSCPRLLASQNKSSKDMLPVKPARLESQSCPRLIAQAPQSSKDMSPSMPSRRESQPLCRSPATEPDNVRS